MKSFIQYIRELAMKDYRKTKAYQAISSISDETGEPGMENDVEVDGDPSTIKKAMEKFKPSSVTLGRYKDIYRFSDSIVYVDKQQRAGTKINLLYYEIS